MSQQQQQERPVIYQKRVGTRLEVWRRVAKQTSGGLKRDDFMINKRGRLVSKRRSASSKKSNNLVKAGYETKKGVFKLFDLISVHGVFQEKGEVGVQFKVVMGNKSHCIE